MVLPDGHSPTIEAIRRAEAPIGVLLDRSSPLVERVGDNHVFTFVHRVAEVTEVGLYLSAPHHDMAVTRPMTLLPDSDVWVASVEAPADLHLLYAFLPEPPPSPFTEEHVTSDVEEASAEIHDLVSQLVPDAANPWSVQIDLGDGAFALSVLQGPGAPDLSALIPRSPAASTPLREAVLGSRRAWFCPPAVEHGPSDLLVVLDGQMFQRAGLADVLQRLQLEGEIPPTALVLVDSAGMVARVADLMYSEDFVTFVRDALVPWVEQECSLASELDRRIIAGASLGGSASCYLATRLPQVFGRAVAMSPAVFVEHGGKPAWLLEYLRSAPVLPQHVDVSIGIMEDLMLPTTRALAEVLRERGCDVQYDEYSGAHDIAGWLPALYQSLRRPYLSLTR